MATSLSDSGMAVASEPFWHVRAISGAAIVVGQLLFGYNVLMTALGKGPQESEP